MNILITGTSKGIGLSLAKRYTEAGHRVFGCSRSHANYFHPLYTHFVVDITQEEEVLLLVSSLKKEFKKLDVLINNAGIASMNHFLFTSLEKAKSIMDTNFFAPFSLCRACINLLKKSNQPRIINFTTVAVPLNLEGELAYVASKAALESMTKILAKELSSFNITVNAIGPTPVATSLISGVPENTIESLINKQAIKRFATADDIANVIDFFIKKESNFISGQIMYLGGIVG